MHDVRPPVLEPSCDMVVAAWFEHALLAFLKLYCAPCCTVLSGAVELKNLPFFRFKMLMLCNRFISTPLFPFD